MARLEQVYPSTASYWRSVVLSGRNTATLKFALAESLLEVVNVEKTFVRLDELAVSYSYSTRARI